MRTSLCTEAASLNSPAIPDFLEIISNSGAVATGEADAPVSMNTA